MRLPTTSLAGLLVTLRFSVVAAMDPFQLMEAREVVDMLKLFENQYPDFVKVANGQDSYGLPRAGTKQDCLYDGTLAGCLNHFFTIQDFMAHPVGSSSSAALPEMLWIGGLHSSDEELGPTVVMETASVLLEAAACEAKPRLHVRSREWDQEVTEALACRADLRAMGVEDTHRQWLARLVATRRIVVMPNANALGFSRGEHLEEGVDPAEDFPYNNDYSEGCMRTIAARTLNELFMDHMFQVVLTFQHGENKIESAWSTQPWLSPDLVTFHDFSESLSMVGGGKGKYPFGQGNADSLKVGERFQDWAYAASWENIRIRSCKPDSYGGYEHDKTERYPISSNRAVAMTISTKISDEIEGGATLGNVFDVFHGDDSSDGLAVARNMRLALVSADLLQPYISIYGVNNLAITDDVIPSLRRADNICDTSRAVTVPVSLGTVIFEWTVGGGLDINQTDLWVALAKNLPGQSACEMNLDENFDEFQQIFEKVPLWGTGPKSGTGFFSRGGPNPSPRISLSKPFSLLTGGSLASANSNSMGGMTNQDNTTTAINILGPVFRAEIDLSHFKVGDMLIVVASAKVDQGWAEPPSGYHQPFVDPQSHLANTRTKPGYEYEISEKRLVGRLNWQSPPVTVLVQDIDWSIGAIELYKRLEESTGYARPPMRPFSLFDLMDPSATDGRSFMDFWIYILIAAVALMVLAIATLYTYRVHRRKQANAGGFPTSKDGITKLSKNEATQSQTICHSSNGKEGIMDMAEVIDFQHTAIARSPSDATPRFA